MRLIQSINQFDVRMFLACVNTRHQRQLCRLAYGVSKTGDGYSQVLLPAALYALGLHHSELFAASVAAAFAIWLPLYWVLKNTCRRRRPPAAIPRFNAAIIASDEFSFPSGHTAAAFLLATLCVLFYGAAGAPLFLWATAVGASRILLGVHFPTDTLAGAALGIGIAHLSHALVVTL
ncbi:MAG: phosphatase PAP2 family protein [Spongiibacter sp.]|uniref:undecaprenyl-diphosphate phosphatase n=1 Tax=Spongiibacter thalassae TaxID=2721624 RepID=A0ABX1GGW8_9GAMM|nr:phosphatase PAP2 family protein [Spongiibacter thalassae]MDX1504387.1 phosphatase PAP2 family protein [Spongiibacter sp.]NKI17737.1 phosphatase PAP2 family protein [Spongiibacter thalassae]